MAQADANARWRDAIGQVDNFLIAFPDHRSTARMKLVRGHLHMKLREFDAARTASSDQQLADQLHLHWVRKLPPLEVAWPDQDMMWFDRQYEPMCDRSGARRQPEHALGYCLGLHARTA